MLSRDRLRRGDLELLQPQRGYRFTFDALLLADFALAAARRNRALAICDLGAGCGVVGLVLLRALPGATLCAVELQPRLAALACRNLVDNGLGDRGEVLELDVASTAARRRLKGARFDWVVCNPPYQAVGRGISNPNGELAVARHELRLPLDRLCAELRRILRPRGQAALIYPAPRLAELLVAASAVGLAPIRMRACHPRPAAPATRVLVLFEKGGGAGRLHVDAPLHEYDERGAATDEARRIGG
jgi:tRNA1Val (adenine37-N6)-methyltransferase